mmetsp:Transcript_44183/g.117016  ORF Transcript_44183/g.117016 Transcript_44183/m.117016 type:complete len:576 (-) Transcript_44183:456-2183(-)|eukprot:CAMPEP_0194488072 /NCGR_PEP_ID=MMETSP0253-20130528/8131_1 /TAXON_ID=2966 /ORGANISM="Noctiluca scintillans" /LENGTH=575 /DNA_ID=CAMNT_0039328393 /DNA_START=1 /DNA_END=1728 /DNA_ORIENTATION=+
MRIGEAYVRQPVFFERTATGALQALPRSVPERRRSRASLLSPTVQDLPKQSDESLCMRESFVPSGAEACQPEQIRRKQSNDSMLLTQVQGVHPQGQKSSFTPSSTATLGQSTLMSNHPHALRLGQDVEGAQQFVASPTPPSQPLTQCPAPQPSQPPISGARRAIPHAQTPQSLLPQFLTQSVPRAQPPELEPCGPELVQSWVPTTVSAVLQPETMQHLQVSDNSQSLPSPAAPGAQLSPAQECTVACTSDAGALSQSVNKYVAPQLPGVVPLGAGVERLVPSVVQDALRNKACILIDVRDADRQVGWIEDSLHVPAMDAVPWSKRVPTLMEGWRRVPLVVFHCLYSAHRAPTCANWYRERVDEQRVAILHEGFRGWQGNGFPVTYPTQESETLPPPSQCVANTAVHTDVASSGKYVKPAPVPNAVPVASGVEELDPGTVYAHLASHECLLVDLRDTDRESGVIEGSVHVPAIDVVSFPSKIPFLVPAWAEQTLVVFMCQYSTHRAPQCANWYREKADSKQRVAVLVDGYRGWECSGLPAKHSSATSRDAAADEFAVQQGLRFAASQLGAPVVTAS